MFKINPPFLFLLIFCLSFFISCSTIPQPQPSPSKASYRADLNFHPKAKFKTFTHYSPTLCFDEGHHNLSVENGFYKPVLELLESDGYQVIHHQGAFTSESLIHCHIVYSSAVLPLPTIEESKKIKNPSAFTDQEINNLYSWVIQGGSLIVMTDHKPMGTAAGPLLKKFGIYGSDTNVKNPKYPIYPFKDDGIFKLDRSLMNTHSPIIEGRTSSEKLNQIFFFYGQALKGPSEADLFLQTGPDAKFGEEDSTNTHEPASFPAAALALKIQQGRLVVFGDGTVFTSKIDLKNNEPTGINRPGSDNVQMALNVFHWLSGLLDTKIKNVKKIAIPAGSAIKRAPQSSRNRPSES